MIAYQNISLEEVFSRALTIRLQIVTDPCNGSASGFLDSGVEGSVLRSWQVMFESLRLLFLLLFGLFNGLIGRFISWSSAEFRQVQHEVAPRDHRLAFSEIRGQIFIFSWEITLLPMIF